MPEKSTYLVTVEKREPQSPAQAESRSSNHEIYSEKDRLAMKREDYFFKAQKKDAERRLSETLLSGEYSDLMKLLTSLSTLGIGVMLFKKDPDKAFTVSYSLALASMLASLLFAFLSYIFSIRSLRAWTIELTDLEKPYEEMEQIPNDALHIFIALSAITLFASCIAYLCYVA